MFVTRYADISLIASSNDFVWPVKGLLGMYSCLATVLYQSFTSSKFLIAGCNADW